MFLALSSSRCLLCTPANHVHKCLQPRHHSACVPKDSSLECATIISPFFVAFPKATIAMHSIIFQISAARMFIVEVTVTVMQHNFQEMTTSIRIDALVKLLRSSIRYPLHKISQLKTKSAACS